MAAGLFAPGDIIVAATDVDDSNVDLRNHKGAGRLLHYDAAFALKTTLWTETEGLVIGLGRSPRSGDLFACDSAAKAVIRFDDQGKRHDPWGFLPERGFSNILFNPGGELAWLGVHSSMRGDPHAEDAMLFEIDVVQQQATPLDAAWDGGKFGFHRITHTALTGDGVLFYVSENGRRVMRYDLSERKQLSDFMRLEDDDPRGTCGLAVLADGSLLMATGSGAYRFDPDGLDMQRYDIPEEKGWARLQLSAVPGQFWISNFFTGILERREIDSGAVLQRHDIQRKYALCGLVEIPAEQG